MSAARRPLDADSPRHGTRYAYVYYRCRCDACRAANAAHQAERRARFDYVPSYVSHGHTSTYSNYSCRCGPCNAAHNRSMREQKASRVQRGLPTGDPRHGTRYGYAQWGCRCDACRRASREHDKARRAS